MQRKSKRLFCASDNNLLKINFATERILLLSIGPNNDDIIQSDGVSVSTCRQNGLNGE
jgi:hypothetical protein